MPKFSVGDTAYVAASLLSPPPQQAFEYAMAHAKVATVKNPPGKGGNQVELEYTSVLGAITTSPPISISKVHKRLGILVVRIGDLGSEALLLDPLANSIQDFCRLLLGEVTLLQVRSVPELAAWCAFQGNMRLYSHVILVGHGSTNSIEFTVGGAQSATSIGKALHISNSNKKVILSVACETGDPAFAKAMSKSTSCLFFIGPESPGSAAMGSLFCQHFLTENIVDGATPGVAFKHTAQLHMARSPTYALWKNGKKQA